MRYKYLIILLFVAFISLSSAQSRYYSVKYVYDGDTILIDKDEKVRYLGIDAPELDHQGGDSEFMASSSRNYNLQLVGHKRVRLEFDREKRDRYGRLLAYVFLENGEMVNGILVKKGFAHIMSKPPNLKYLNLLLGYQRKAMSKRLGIWQSNPINLEKYYIGSKKSYRFHRPGCPYAKEITSQNRLRFANHRKAFWEGFSPCKRCSP